MRGMRRKSCAAVWKERVSTRSHSDPLGLKHGTLSLSAYSQSWPDLFQDEAALILSSAPDLIVKIEHIGSTSVPGLRAKPILDIAVMAAIKDHTCLAKTLCAIGYIDRGERDGRLFIRVRNGGIRTHNLHLFDTDDSAMARQVAFRDALRAIPQLREDYAALKARLVQEYADNRAGYAPAKSDFIRAALCGAQRR